MITRLGAPVLAGGLLLKIFLLQGFVRLAWLMWDGQQLAAAVVLHVFILAAWAIYARRRRRHGRELPAGFYAGLRPKRRQSDLRWVRTTAPRCWSSACYISPGARAGHAPAVELLIGAAGLTPAGEPSLAERLLLAAASLAWPVCAAAFTATLAPGAVPYVAVAVAVAALAGAMRHGRCAACMMPSPGPG